MKLLPDRLTYRLTPTTVFNSMECGKHDAELSLGVLEPYDRTPDLKSNGQYQ